MVKGFASTDLTEVRTASRAPTFRSRSNGNETTLILSATTAKTNPIALPNPISNQPSGVARIIVTRAIKDFGGAVPKSDTKRDWAANTQDTKITSSNEETDKIDRERITPNTGPHDVSSPSSRRRLISYSPIPAKGPTRAKPAVSGKSREIGR